jgi:hypothetical protein
MRRLMVAVAVAGLLINEFLQNEKRRVAFLATVDWHEARAYKKKTFLIGLDGKVKWTNFKGDIRPAREFPSRDKNDWHLLMIEKYRWAARYYWLPILPDPREPE